MCGGVAWNAKNISEQELKKFYSKAEIKNIKTQGKAKSFFWDKNANLPVKTKSGIELITWGNKDEDIKLPKTGWARLESYEIGKWNWLNPKLVDIPANFGYEKKVWFEMPKGTKGLVVTKGNKERIYMLTKAASKDYIKHTQHDREPLGLKKYKIIIN